MTDCNCWEMFVQCAAQPSPSIALLNVARAMRHFSPLTRGILKIRKPIGPNDSYS